MTPPALTTRGVISNILLFKSFFVSLPQVTPQHQRPSANAIATAGNSTTPTWNNSKKQA